MPFPCQDFRKNKHYALMYSLGVSFFYTGQAKMSFDCFTEAVQHLHNNQRLWLRMFYNLSQICELNKILKHYLTSSCIIYI